MNQVPEYGVAPTGPNIHSSKDDATVIGEGTKRGSTHCRLEATCQRTRTMSGPAMRRLTRRALARTRTLSLLFVVATGVTVTIGLLVSRRRAGFWICRLPR